MKLLFDENFGRPITDSIKPFVQFFEPHTTIIHLFEIALPGTKDKDWVPLLASDQEYIVISTDAGKKNEMVLKLPMLCIQYQVRHILVRGTLLKRKQYEKVKALFHVWLQIVALSAAPPGTRMHLCLRNEIPVLEIR